MQRLETVFRRREPQAPALIEKIRTIGTPTQQEALRRNLMWADRADEAFQRDRDKLGIKPKNS